MDHIFDPSRQRFRGLGARNPAGDPGVEHEDGKEYQALRVVCIIHGLTVSLPEIGRGGHVLDSIPPIPSHTSCDLPLHRLLLVAFLSVV